MGNGEKMEIKLQGIGFVTDLLVFCLDGEDVVLGMKWLESLRDIKANFKLLKLRIKKDESSIIFWVILPYQKGKCQLNNWWWSRKTPQKPLW